MDPRPTNDLIAQLERRLSPDGRKALEDTNALELKFATTEGAQAPTVEKALDVLDTLSDRDRELVSQILQLRGRAYEERAAEYLGRFEAGPVSRVGDRAGTRAGEWCWQGARRANDTRRGPGDIPSTWRACTGAPGL